MWGGIIHFVMNTIENHSIGAEKTWTDEDGLEYRELIRQEYSNCGFYGGQVLNHLVDRLYILWQKGESLVGCCCAQTRQRRWPGFLQGCCGRIT